MDHFSLNELWGTTVCAILILLVLLSPVLISPAPKKPMVIDHPKKREDMDCVEKFLQHYHDTRMWKNQDPYTFIQNNQELKGYVYYYGISGKSICTRFMMKDLSKLEIMEYNTQHNGRLVRRVYEKGTA